MLAPAFNRTGDQKSCRERGGGWREDRGEWKEERGSGGRGYLKLLLSCNVNTWSF